MRQYKEQAVKALEVYCARGEAALDALLRDDLPTAEQLLLKRKAAFHNFRVADQLALDQGFDSSQDPVAIELVKKSQILDRRIEVEMRKAQNSTLSKLKKYTSSRKNIGKFRSTLKSSSSFQQTI